MNEEFYLITMKCLNCGAKRDLETSGKDYHQAIYDNDVEHAPDCPGERVYISSQKLEVVK